MRQPRAGSLPELSGERRGIPAAETLVQDVRYGLRMLAKSPGITAIVAITLALGIGVNTAIFSVLDGWLLRPLPVRAPEQIVVLAAQHKERRNPKFSYPDLLDFEKQAGALSDVFAYGLAPSGGLSDGGRVSQFAYSAVTGNYFSALGVNPALGRLILPGEGEKPGEPLLVVLGYSYWQKRFDGDRGVAGKQVRVDGKPATIVGVAQKEFHGTLFSIDMDGYVSLSAMSDQESGGFWTDRNDRRLNVFGRLQHGVSLRQAQSSADVIAARLASQYPATNEGVTVRVFPERLTRPAPFVASFVPIIASLFLSLAGLVLLLACMNVANLLLARTAARQHEMAIRAALGAGRVRLIRQMLTEGLLLAFLGGIAGVVLGEWALDASGSLLHSVTNNSANYGFRLDVSLDWRVFTYALAAALLTGIFVGLWPALRASRADVNRVLHEGGRSDSAGAGRHRVRSFLVVAQVAGSVMLLIVAGLFVRSLGRAEHMYLGFDPNGVLAVMLDPHEIDYDQPRTNAFYRQLEDRVRAMPGVQSASLSFTVPLTYLSKGGAIYVEGHPLTPGQQPPTVSFNSIDPAYIETMRVPLLEGRAFRESDQETAPPVAIVNQTMARKFWPNEDPIGKRFSLKSAGGPFIGVVGLARDGQYLFLSPEPQPYFYLPLAQSYSSLRTLEVRSAVPPESLITGVQEQIRKLAPDLPVLNIGTMQQTVHGLAGLFLFRLAATLAAVMGMLGLLLAIVGVYGVVSFAVSQRTHEIGVRMALGAERGDIVKLVARQGLALVVAGVVSGLAAASALARAMTKLLIGVSATDPMTYATVAILLAAVTLLACWIPARRALRVDPMVALRHE
ncbi:MAG TPA: ABC transporter permease [Bryobacterales bacterium]|nr:ABC transporter permease [Bryobacterales bacterium]